MVCSDNFFFGKFNKGHVDLKPLLNSTFFFFQLEIFGRRNQGEGVLNTYGYEYEFLHLIEQDFLELDKLYRAHEKLAKRNVKNIFEECGVDPHSHTPILKQEPTPMEDRKELDNLVFSALNLSEKERKDVYRYLCKLVYDRLDKDGNI